jgi:serine/threonine protein kinase/Tfp pilus assembly protein PilF
LSEKEGGIQLEQLVGECAERMASEGIAALEDLCRQNPEQADQLRAAMQPLLEFGVVGAEGDAGDARPKQLGEYELLGEIGRGGMGVVFKARQASLDRNVALKVLHAHLTLDESTIERFRREGRTAASLKHPGIVEVHGFGQEEGHSYLAMELVHGAPLDQFLQELRNKKGKPSVEDLPDALAAVLRERGNPELEVSWSLSSIHGGLVAIVRSIALALHHAHEAGVVHRDVKPSKILLRPDGQPVLTDFGLARGRDLPGLTQTGTLTGTPFYMSPEQASGSRAELDRRSDVFSLGATLYEMLTRTRPFPGDSSQQVMQDIQRREPLDPQRLRPDLPGDLAAVILKSLEKDPAERYQTAAEFAADLGAFLELRPVTARKASAARRLRRWMRREPLKASIAGLLILGIPTVAGLGGFVWANQPLVEMAEKQRQLELAEDALMQGYFEMMHGRRTESQTQFRVAMQQEETYLEAFSGMVLSLASNARGADRALAFIEDEAGDKKLSRTIQRLRAICFDVAGRREDAELILAELGNPVEPIEHFLEGWKEWRQAYGSGPNKQRAYEHFLSAAVLSETPRAIFHHRLALTAGDLRHESGARRSAAALQRFWPDSAFAWEGVGLALEEIDPPAAVAAFRKAIELDTEGRATIHGNLALTLYMMGETDASIAEYETALSLREDNDHAHYGLARLYLYQRRDLDKALEHAREAARLAGADVFKVAHHRLYMRVLVRAGRVEDAITAGEEALALQPESIPLMRELASTYMNVPDPVLAEETIQGALDLDPANRESLQLLADARSAQGNLDGAVEAQRLRAQARPKDAEGWRLVALRQLKKREDGTRVDPEGSLQNARKALNLLTEEDPYMLHSYASALLACGRLDESEKYRLEAEAVASKGNWPKDSELRGYLDNLRQRLEKERSK